MRQTFLLVALAFILNPIFAQHMGNANVQHRVHLPSSPINIPFPNSDEYIISIKGLSNIKADNYIAIFSIKQSAKTADEVNTLIDNRINPVIEYCNNNEGVSHFIDMVSFLPIYELDLVKKIFNKKTYNEVPKGFEVKKNLHIKYKNPGELNKIIEICSKNEIYDLVRVDYFSDSIEEKKKELMLHAKKILQEKLKNKADILEVEFSEYDKQMRDGYTVVYPIEMYKQYVSSSTTKFDVDKNSSINKAKQSTTYYYKPFFDKNFDFTINPTIFEPVIQIMYEIKVKYTPKKEDPKPVVTKAPEPQVKTEVKYKKDVVIVTQSGQMKTITLE